MLQLHHHAFSAASRFARLALAEYGVPVELAPQRPWERRPEFLAVNPASAVPVLVENNGPPVCGAWPILEYLDETRGFAVGERRLMPDHPEARAEMRRLVDWFLSKFEAEVGHYLVAERIFKLEMPRGAGGGEPDAASIRAGRANVRPHLKYLGYLAATRHWLAGPRLTFADLAAASALSVVDYLGEIPWDEDEHARNWYARVKSRRSFRPLLAERVPGLPPAATYADLDF